MVTDDHGECPKCGLDYNGERVYDHFLEEYGDPAKALAVASMYGCREGFGRFGKQILVTSYDEDGNKTKTIECPSCRKGSGHGRTP